jgi:DNA repair exonuclease SbcCD ATPase subunit
LIHFNYVRWKNFLSTGNNFTEIQLDRSSTTLIIGENGAGKSTILDALCFGLFGKPFRNINKPQLLNSVNASNCLVEVEFKVGGKDVKVARGIKPNVFEIYINGKMYNQDANSRDYQKYLEQQILKLNYRSFTQVVILGSSTFVPFMQLKARHRREVVEEILDIQIFSLMNMILKQKLKTIEADHRELEYKESLTSEKLTLKKRYIQDIQDNRRKLIEEKTVLIGGNEEEIFKKKRKIADLQDDIEGMHEKISNAAKVVEQFDKLNDLNSQLKTKHRSHKRLIKFFEENEDCPTCQQHIDEDHKDTMLSNENKKYEKLTVGIKELADKLEATKVKINVINEVNKNIQSNNVEIAKENSSIGELEKFNATLDTEVKQLQDGRVDKKDHEEVVSLQEEFDTVSKEKNKLREEKVYSDAVRTMLTDQGIKTKIIKQYLPIMNKLINTYLTSMEFYVNFTLDENFDETIKSRYRDDFTYASFSEGEKMRIDLALLFTWRAVAKMKNSANTNLLILDEIFDSSLDGTGTDEFLKILNTLSDENIFVISHKQDALADKFRSTIRFEKVKNFSHISE